MKSKLIKLSIVALAVAAGFGLASSLPTFADSVCGNSNVSAEVRAAAGCGGDSVASLHDVIGNILYAVIGISGLVAVGFIIYGGGQYITSSGDSAKVQKAKNTILYACIGLVVCVLAFAIVNWAIAAIERGAAANYTDKTACEEAGYQWENKQCEPKS